MQGCHERPAEWQLLCHLPLKRQPWYEHCSVPSDGSILPCDSGASLQTVMDVSLSLCSQPCLPSRSPMLRQMQYSLG